MIDLIQLPHLLVLAAHFLVWGALALGMVNVATGGPTGPTTRRTYTLDANQTLTQGYGMIQGSLDESVANPTGAGQMAVGVVEFLPFGAETAVSIIVKGECDAVCSAAINAGQFVKMDANGAFVPSSTTGDFVIGRARTSCSTSGDHFILDVGPFVY
ncbi:MAG: capsid cement protein [Candidatus Acidiferrales bacterium]